MCNSVNFIQVDPLRFSLYKLAMQTVKVNETHTHTYTSCIHTYAQIILFIYSELNCTRWQLSSGPMIQKARLPPTNSWEVQKWQQQLKTAISLVCVGFQHGRLFCAHNSRGHLNQFKWINRQPRLCYCSAALLSSGWRGKCASVAFDLISFDLNCMRHDLTGALLPRLAAAAFAAPRAQ